MYYLGIDLGGTNIVAGVVDEEGNIIVKASCKTNIPRSQEEICDDMASVALKALESAGLTKNDINYVGIGAPGAVNGATGVIEFTSNFGFHNWAIGDMMNERLGLDIYVENDANAAAYGEFCVGAAKDANDAIVITLGTGVGGGIIIDGQIYSGSNYAGAELGHMVIHHGGRQCPCGRKGCWEAYSSATGIINMTKEAMINPYNKDSILYKMINGDVSKIDGKTAFDAMHAGCPVGKAIVDEYISYLGTGIVNIINIFQPEILCIGGGVSYQGAALIDPLRKIVEAERYTKHNDRQTEICLCQLGNDAGLIGAAYLGK
ncbi:MAG: ROK family glucokinase [Clostridia bacterium]|nr:ROK family glucokinase [Clostridia bacterium]